MSVIFEFRRHSIKDGYAGKCLGPIGRRLAREVGRHQLRGLAFTDFFASSLCRTHETFAEFSEGAGDFGRVDEPENAPIYVYGSDRKALLAACSAVDKFGGDMVRYAYRAHHQVLADVANRIADQFESWRAGFQDHSRVLVIGHSPDMEFLAYGLKSVVVPGLKPCQGYRVEWDGQAYRIDYLSPELDPAPLLARIAPQLI